MSNQQIKNHVLKLLSKNYRLDGRKLDEYRKPISVECGVSKSAEGSARVKIGDTEVIVGVKMTLGTPFPDTPDEGCLMVGVELYPLSSPEFESGPPSIQAIELARVTDRGIRESKAMDLKKLCVKEGELVWLVCIDMCTINDAGNLFDACALAAIAALKDAKMPKLDGEKVDYSEKTNEGLPLSKVPINVTVLKIGNGLFVDPVRDEERAYDARLSVAVTEDGTICALQKGGEAVLSVEDADKMIGLAVEKCGELRKYLG